MAKKIERLPEVINRTGISSSGIYARISDGTFPKPVSIGPRAVGWVSSEVDDWIDQCIRASRGQATGNDRGE